MRIQHIHETILYGESLDEMERFYTVTLGFRRVGGDSPRGRAVRVNESQVLLLFRASETVKPHAEVPSHGATGAGHVAFSVGKGELADWRAKLTSAGFAIEREVAWPLGGRSIYMRDPAGNSVEFTEGKVWPD